jgi:hypothetical protein
MNQHRRTAALPLRRELGAVVPGASRPDRPLRGPAPAASAGSGARLAAHALAFAGGAGLILAYALRGGAYDIVVFEEYGFVVWAVVAIGVALGLLPRTKPSRPALLLMGAVLAYSAWTALSLTWTESSELTFEETARSMGYLGLIVLVAFALDNETWRSAAAGIGLGALIVCVLAVASRLAPGAFPPNVVGTTFHTDRLSYPFGYWNSVGAWGAMSTAIGLAWSVHERRRPARALALALVPIACVATYLSYSRAGAAGTALAGLLVVGLSRNRLTALLHCLAAAAGAGVVIFAVRGEPQIATATGTKGASTILAAILFSAVLCAVVALTTDRVSADGWSLPRRVFRPLAIGSLVIALAAAGAFGPRLVSHAWHAFTRNTTVQSSDPAARLTSLSGSRYTVWKVALKAFDRHPVTGTGAGTFEFWWNQHGTDVEFLRDAHSIWVENMAELGLPGLLLIALVAAAAGATGILARQRARRRATAGVSAAFLSAFIVYLLEASFDWTWESTAVTVLALVGVAVVSVRLAGRLPPIRWPVRLALVIFAVIGAAVQVPGLVSTVDIRRSQAAERAGHGAQALAWANNAVSAEPWAASPYDQRGLVLESGGRLAAAALSLQRAVDNERTNYTHWVLLARVETERGILGPAADDYEQAHRLRPLSGLFLLAGLFKTTR